MYVAHLGYLVVHAIYYHLGLPFSSIDSATFINNEHK